MNCFLYCRKSSEDQSRQVQSIDDQKKVLLELAQFRGLKVVEIFSDEKSAGKPYQRPGFQSMMQRINDKEASIILSWKIDRLSRNPIENGQISWMLQQGIIKEIITPERSYLPQDNVLLFMVEGAMANQYLRDLSTNVKRGMQSKVEKGLFPSLAPLGYVNEGKHKGSKYIAPDPVYFPRLKALWELLKKQEYQLAGLYQVMKDKYPLYKNGRILAFSSFHRIFHNPFYCGLFRWKGSLQLGTHKTMITQGEFEEIQQFLGRNGTPRKRQLEFDFKGVFKCGGCEACITAERKHKYIISENREKAFDYYRCTHRKRDVVCHEKPVSKQQLEAQILEEIEKFKLPYRVIDYGIERLNLEERDEMELQQGNVKHIENETQILKKRMKSIEENIATEPDAEIRQIMKKKHTEAKIKIKRITENHTQRIEKAQQWIDMIIEKMRILRNAKYTLLRGTHEQKQRLLKNIGLNWKIRGKKIDYEPHFVVEACLKTKEIIMPETDRFEPAKPYIPMRENLSHEEVIYVWSTWWEFIRNRF